MHLKEAIVGVNALCLFKEKAGKGLRTPPMENPNASKVMLY
ncbi:MAG: hypothetical protein QW282_01350 [Nitrososphaerales archaeon]